MHPNTRFPNTIRQNIDTIARLEEKFLERQTLAERIGDTIANFVGSMSFVLLHVAWFLAWIVLNAKLLPGLPAFDPYPYLLLSVIVSLEAVILSTFVLIKQNRMSRRADERAQLDLQINLLSEREATKNLQLLQRLCAHFGLKNEAADAEVNELSQTTAVEDLAEDLKEKLNET